ncbi:VOC family protein [Pseudactinotalea sp. Z1732]|uniref:VOC family protein n=1 Tax=Micrococcales TaxID=85006 RepID=UPI003C79B7D5
MNAPVPTHFDHLVYAGPDLNAAVAEFTERTGVAPAPGGKHPRGTANHLVAFTVDGQRTRGYLEIIGPDPDRPSTEPITTFGIDALDDARLVTFAVHPPDLESVIERARADGYDPGPIEPLSRRTPEGTELHWRLSRPRAHSPAVPFLIDWGSTDHPALGDLPTVELLGVQATHPEPDRVRGVLDLLGVDLSIESGASTTLHARLQTPNGPVHLT